MADGFHVETNAGAVAANLEHAGVVATVRAAAVTRHYGMILLTTWRRNASLPRTAPRGPGMSGLRLFTGDYVRRLNLRTFNTPGAIVAEVGTDHPGGHRLEMGFVGIDSLGRQVHSPPYPTARPALAEVEQPFIAAIATVAGDL
jgi:hypothetical protein